MGLTFLFFCWRHTHSGQPTACSFIRPHPTKVLTARPLVPVLIEKYLDPSVKSDTYVAEKDLGEVYFGGRKDLVVETVGFEKVQRKQSQLNRLLVVGLADLQVGLSGDPGDIAQHDFRKLF